MSTPTTKAIRTRLQQQHIKDADGWARFLTGLQWSVIKPLVQIATNSRTHPALAAGMVARTTSDEHIRTLLQGHLESKAPPTGDPGPPQTPTT